MTTDRFLLGYAIGLIVGEGHFGSPSPNANGGTARLVVKLNRDDAAPLHTLKAVFGGRILGPYTYERRGGGKPYDFLVWHLTSSELAAAVPVLVAEMPPCRKRDQLLAWCERHGLLL